MSVSRLVTVWCNGCGNWEHTGHDAKEAREHAKASSWAVSVAGTDEAPADPTARSLWRAGAPRDFCPGCVRRGLA